MRGVFTFLVLGFAFLFCALTGTAADYALVDGASISGQPISFTTDGVIIKSPDGSLSPRTAYSRFTQETLKKLSTEARAADKVFIEPFLEEVVQERKRQKEILVEKVETIPRPEGVTGIAALFGSPIGLMFILVIYLANLHAGNEIGMYKNWPRKIALGSAAVLPIVAPIVLLCLPARGALPAHPLEEESAPVAEEPQEVAAPPNPALSDPGNPATAASAAAAPAPAGLSAAEAQIYSPPPKKNAPARAPIALPQSAVNVAKSEAAAAAAASALPTDVVTYARKDFTFNKRFFETKMPGFFRVVLSEADQQKVILIKSARGNFMGQRITKVTPTELTLQIFRDNVTADESIPFNEIHEVIIAPRESEA